MKIFDASYFDNLTVQARDNWRQRQHRNIHQSYQEPCQRLFNAIEPSSYIRPHRHATEPSDELLVAIRGAMSLVTFNDLGSVIDVLDFGVYGKLNLMAVGVEIPANIWHTVLAHESGSVLLEVKKGPFNPSASKDLALWATVEGSALASEYLDFLLKLTRSNYSSRVIL